MAGKNRRISTKEDSLSRAKEVVEDWYLEMRGKNRIGELKNEKTFKFAAKQFEIEYEIITEGQRNTVYVRSHKDRIRVSLNPFFGDKGLSEVTLGLVQDYRIHRMKSDKPSARNTLHHEIVTLLQVLKTATHKCRCTDKPRARRLRFSLHPSTKGRSCLSRPQTISQMLRQTLYFFINMI